MGRAYGAADAPINMLALAQVVQLLGTCSKGEEKGGGQVVCNNNK